MFEVVAHLFMSNFDHLYAADFQDRRKKFLLSKYLQHK